jgi:hypothetical protein
MAHDSEIPGYTTDRNWLRSDDYFNSLIQYAACKNSGHCDLKNRVNSRLPRLLGKTSDF